MNVLHIGPLPGDIHLLPENDFLNSRNLFREIQVDDPENVFEEPIFLGPAWQAPEVLEPGTYYYVYTDEQNWEI